MLELLEMLAIGFTVGMTGALVPGPMLFATIDTSLKRGWQAGPEIFIGHANANSAAGSMHEHRSNNSNPILAGIVASASNPYFWLWWLAAGSTLVLKGLEISMLAAALFVVGYWMADRSYFTVVSTSFSRGKKLMSPKLYERVLMSCGLFLALFGSWFIVGT
ncbi:MAG: LysE family transporter [Methanolobus sp.]|uniref:LysE family transporter n=1 Tax=Methanolobus sp. TaxID=1874737 RepID=UPI00272F9C4D|nr:LysE family transporter [Methanolobus sp.]MDP2215946.1 LysE family transporter [Methanolobus sp.]